VRSIPRLRSILPGARLAYLLSLAVMLAACPGTATASAQPIPRADYPPSTRIQYFADWSNRQFDCNFGWNCDSGLPFLHARTEDQLHRNGGWAMWGHWHNDTMGFELYSSVYDVGPAPDSHPWSEYAAGDERVALVALNGGIDAKTLPAVLPCGTPGSTFAVWVDKGTWHVLFITVTWAGTHEIEGAALYPRKRKWEARNYLIKQVRAAVLQTDPTLASYRAFGVNGVCP